MASTLIVSTSLIFVLMASTTLAYAHRSYWLAFIKGNIYNEYIKMCRLWTMYFTTKDTVVWKIFVWNYFVVKNFREKFFCGFPVPTKIF